MRENGVYPEEVAKDKFKETTSEVESRVADVRKKLGLDTDDTDQKIEELSAKVDALTEAVAKLAANKQQLVGQPWLPNQGRSYYVR